MAGYGSDFTWGTNAITTPPGSGTQYMSYPDNPDRPLLRYWFGPMAMVDYLHNYNLNDNITNYNYLQPGDSYEAPIYTAKEAYKAAVTTMQNEHPNDWVTVIPYSWPRSSATDGNGRFNCVTCPLGTNYNYATSALFFPFSTINADGSPNLTEVTPYDPDPATGLIPSANFHGHAAGRRRYLLRHGPHAGLQPVRRHTLQRQHAEGLCQLLPHHLPRRHGGRNGTQGVSESCHLRDRRPGQLPGQCQPGECRIVQLL